MQHIREYSDFKMDQPGEGIRPRGSEKVLFPYGWWSDDLNNFAEFTNRNSQEAIAHFVKYCKLRVDAYEKEFIETRKVLHDQAAQAAASPMCAQAPTADSVARLRFLRQRAEDARNELAAAEQRFKTTEAGKLEQHREWLRQRERERSQQSGDLLRQIDSVLL